MTVLTVQIPLTRGSRGAWPIADNRRLTWNRRLTPDARAWKATVEALVWHAWANLPQETGDTLRQAPRWHVDLRFVWPDDGGRVPDTQNCRKLIEDAIQAATGKHDLSYDGSHSADPIRQPSASLTITISRGLKEPA